MSAVNSSFFAPENKSFAELSTSTNKLFQERACNFTPKPGESEFFDTDLFKKLTNELSGKKVNKNNDTLVREEIINGSKRSAKYYHKTIERYNDLSYLSCLNDESQKQARLHLQYAMFFLLAQHTKKVNQAKLKKSVASEDFKQCVNALGYLNYGIALPQDTSLDAQKKNYFYRLYESNNCIAYVVKSFIDWIKSSVTLLLTRPTVAARDFMSEVNNHRLYWVWGKSFLLNCIVSSLPDSLNKIRATNEITAPDLVTGYMSFILYYSRLFLNTTMLLKHVIPGWWMENDEKAIGWQTRLSMQWDERGVAILNDVVWATVNMVTFFWLTSAKSATLGNWGNGLTAVLLGFDLALSYYAKKKQQKAVFEELAIIDENIKAIQKGYIKTNQYKYKEVIDSAADLIAGDDKAKSAINNQLCHDIKQVLADLDENHKKNLSEDKIIQLISLRENIVKQLSKANEDKEQQKKLIAYILQQIELNAKIKENSLKVDELVKRRAQLSLDWKYQEKDYDATIISGLAMMIGFSLLLIPLIPGVGLAAAAAIGFASSLILFAFIIAYTFKIYYNKVQKSHEERKTIQQDKECLVSEYTLLQVLEEKVVLEQAINDISEKLELELAKLTLLLNITKKPDDKEIQQQIDGVILQLKSLQDKQDKLQTDLINKNKQLNFLLADVQSIYKDNKAFNKYLTHTASKAEAKYSYYAALIKDNSLTPKQLKLQQLQLFLDLKQLQAEDEHQRQMATYQKINLARAMVTDCIIPTIVLVATLLVPLGAGIGILVGALVVGLVIKVLIDKWFKPSLDNDFKNLELTESDEIEASESDTPHVDKLLNHHEFKKFDTNKNLTVKNIPVYKSKEEREESGKKVASTRFFEEQQKRASVKISYKQDVIEEKPSPLDLSRINFSLS